MKKFWSAILILILAASCSSSGKRTYKKYGKVNQKKLQRIESKFAYKVKPSESMKPGISKSNSSYDFTEKTPQVKKSAFSEDSNYQNAVAKDGDKLTDENGQYRGYFKVGNPYEVFGVSYVPQNYDDFEEIGVASWYGDDFHGKPTANGEIYNMEEMTAAHPTLPLPSLVRVTNLQNGKSVIVRVNDRGPFAKSRIIDVSEKAANALGFKGQGTTQVKIELLRNETDEMLERLKVKN